MNLRPLNTSFKDPQNSVYRDEQNRIIRKIDHVFLPYIEKSSFFVKIIEQLNDGYFHIEKIQFQTFYYEYSFDQLKDSAIDYLNCLEDLLKNDFIFADGNPLNSTYVGKGKFLQFDIGSIRQFDREKGWEGYKQFLTQWLWVIYHLSDKNYIPAGYLWPFINDDQWHFSEPIGIKHKFRPSFWIHHSFLNQSRKYSLNLSHQTARKRTISKQTILGLIALLKQDVKSAKLKKSKSKWDNYYTNTIIGQEYLNQKKLALVNILKSTELQNSAINHFIDWGANDGYFSMLICKNHSHSKVIAIESDYNAVNQLYHNSKNYHIIPVHANLFNPTPAVGFSNFNESLLSRIKNIANVHVVLGLVHHLQHNQNLSFNHIIQMFFEFSLPNSYLIIEFISKNDPRYQLIRNINYPYPESQESFEEALTNCYSIISIQSLTNDRILYFAQKKAL